MADAVWGDHVLFLGGLSLPVRELAAASHRRAGREEGILGGGGDEAREGVDRCRPSSCWFGRARRRDTGFAPFGRMLMFAKCARRCMLCDWQFLLISAVLHIHFCGR